jgi:hypothetical protein
MGFKAMNQAKIEEIFWSNVVSINIDLAPY